MEMENEPSLMAWLPQRAQGAFPPPRCRPQGWLGVGVRVRYGANSQQGQAGGAFLIPSILFLSNFCPLKIILRTISLRFRPGA